MPGYHDADKKAPEDSILAELVADLAVKKTFAILGIDVDQPAQVESFRESLRFSDKLRKAADRGFLAFVSAVVVLLLAALVTGIKFKLGTG